LSVLNNVTRYSIKGVIAMVEGIFDHNFGDTGITSFYGPLDCYGHPLHRNPKEDLDPTIEWTAPINEHEYSTCYKLKSRNDKDMDRS